MPHESSSNHIDSSNHNKTTTNHNIHTFQNTNDANKQLQQQPTNQSTTPTLPALLHRRVQIVSRTGEVVRIFAADNGVTPLSRWLASLAVCEATDQLLVGATLPLCLSWTYVAAAAAVIVFVVVLISWLVAGFLSCFPVLTGVCADQLFLYFYWFFF